MDAQIATNQLTPLGGESMDGENSDQGVMSLFGEDLKIAHDE